eukprot:CAMPEP_0182929828 /NCGR_PEP_ID=MMETSP0105_2-20130417/22827_1 /TAXON_ID=81532 ORGANISM="Acanthoeca-like sp., Strain 10tr" /NCGR_SAMPLE_ID=MMETSP0105_2 /ASSEMBLY_ACC=CAM_ASM_000205 /LENGTH=1523 /DNA_ID=CAMNT_0025068023 /DNA_START=60 /DNA_END=4631 /DNA_ORIENTATION=-
MSFMDRMMGRGDAKDNTDLTAMVSIKPKAGKPCDLTRMFSDYIREHYDEHGDSYSAEIANCNQLRTAALNAAADASGCDAILRWHTQLGLLDNRFAKLFDDGEAKKYMTGIEWGMTFDGTFTAAASLQSERMAMLFNVGALWAELGGRTMKDAGATPKEQDLKTAVKHFKMAAGAFVELERIAKDCPGAVVKDATAEWAAMLRKLMLAQAHECLLMQALSVQERQRREHPEKKLSDFYPKLAIQVAELYDEVHTALLLDNPNQKEYKGLHPWRNWVPSSRIKSMHARAYAHFLQSELCEEDTRYGDEVARLRAAKELCDNMVKLIKAEAGMTASNLDGFFELVNERAEKSEKANKSVFFETVMSEEQLPAIPLPGQMLAQPEPVPSVDAAADIFDRLISIQIHLLASEYSDTKDQIVRAIDAEVIEKNIELEKALSSMGLHDNNYKETDIPLPQVLFMNAAALRDPIEGMRKVERIFEECDAKNTAAHEVITKVKTDFAACKGNLDGVTVAAIETEVASIEHALGQSDATEKAAKQFWSSLNGALRLLSGPADGVRAAMPAHNPVDAPTEGQAASALLESLLGQLKELQVARLNAMDTCRRALESQEILQTLAKADDPAATLAEAKTKAAEAAAPVRANLESQGPLLKAIVEANAGTVEQRKFIKDHQNKQQAFIDELDQAYRNFCELRAKVADGLRFYNGVSKSIEALASKVKIAQDERKQSISTNPFNASELADASATVAQLDKAPAASPVAGGRLSESNPFAKMGAQGMHDGGAPHSGQFRGAAAPPMASPYANASAPPPSPYVSATAPPALMPRGESRRAERAMASSGIAQIAESAANLDRVVDTFMREMGTLEVQLADGRLAYNTLWDELQARDAATFHPSMCSIGIAQQGNGKNRYRDIVPMDAARVHLQSLAGGDDYINASHIRGLLPGSPDFIAAQGPKPENCSAFWKMIQQQRIRTIAMVTNCVEMGKNKCASYWPGRVGETVHYDDSPEGHAVSVTLTQERVFESWVERTLRVEQAIPQRSASIVQQYHFTAWPDRDVPDTPIQFVRYLHAVMAAQHKSGSEALAAGEAKAPPILVHCSAGVGRTGTFVAIYSVLNSLPAIAQGTLRNIDIKSLILGMRSCRRYMIQTPSQLIFTYRTVLHSATEFAQSFKKRAGLSAGPPQSPQAKSGHLQQSPHATSRQAAPQLTPVRSGAAPPRPPPLGTGGVPTRPPPIGTVQEVPPPRPPSIHQPASLYSPLPQSTGHAPQQRRPEHVAGPAGSPLGGPTNQPLPPRQQSGSRKWQSFPPIAVTNRHGNASFINGLYRYVPGSLEREASPVFQREGLVPPGHGSASDRPVYVHYHRGNAAWVITQSVNSNSVIAYATGDDRLETLVHLSGKWHVTESSGYALDARMQVVPQHPAMSPGIASPGAGAPPLAPQYAASRMRAPAVQPLQSTSGYDQPHALLKEASAASPGLAPPLMSHGHREHSGHHPAAGNQALPARAGGWDHLQQQPTSGSGPPGRRASITEPPLFRM